MEGVGCSTFLPIFSDLWPLHPRLAQTGLVSDKWLAGILAVLIAQDEMLCQSRTGSMTVIILSLLRLSLQMIKGFGAICVLIFICIVSSKAEEGGVSE